MAWPDWIEQLKARYLANEASVFLLHGGVHGLRWLNEGEPTDCTGLLHAFLSSSREILAAWSPGEKLRFAAMTDHGAFQRLVETRQALDGRRGRNLARDDGERLALVYLALTTAGPAQGYVLDHAEKIAPARLKNLPSLPDGAPPVVSWASDPLIRQSNNVVVLLADALEAVRADLVDACACIEVPDAPLLVVETPEPVAKARRSTVADPYAGLMSRRAPPPSLADAEAEVEAALSLGHVPTPSATPAAPPPLPDADAPTEQVGDLEPEPPPDTPTLDAAPPAGLDGLVNVALRAAILRHPDGGWQDNLPGREAIAAVIYDVEPNRFGELAFHIVEDKAQCVGPGADAFMDWYRNDIAVDAACSMALGGVEIPEGGLTEDTLPELSPAAVRALARRIEKLLRS
ncbi:MAG: hypothetical protein H6739_01185 [Alphaproteobacteria bacterium]|nr:hypothetical protein [Alphaproteobacteria bacterium]